MIIFSHFIPAVCIHSVVLIIDYTLASIIYNVPEKYHSIDRMHCYKCDTTNLSPRHWWNVKYIYLSTLREYQLQLLKKTKQNVMCL